MPTDAGSGKKGIDLTYTIRPDAKWGDGTPVSTEDVKFTYEVGRNPQSGVGNAEMYRRITGIDVKDDKTFTMHFDKLTFDYAAINDFVLLPAHLERAAFADPTRYRIQTRYVSDPTNPGLYDGPYRITEVVAGSHIVLEPNPYWAGPPGHFRHITVRTIENTAALEANLLSGTIDMVAGELGFSLDQALNFDKQHGSGFQVIYKPGLSYEHVDLNFDRPPLGDRRVRQALLYGIDRDGISRSLFAGKQPVADTFMNPLDDGYTADTPHCPYDPARAGALLDEAGWPMGAGGIRQNAQGQKLSFELMTTSGNRTRELVEQVLQSQWRKIGVEVRLKNEPARVLFGETVPHRNFDMAMYAWTSAPEKRAALDTVFERNPGRGERICRAECFRFQKSGNGQIDRRAGNRTRPGKAQGIVARGAGSVRERTAVTTALFPLGRVYPAEMAERCAPDRQPVPLDLMDHRLDGAASMTDGPHRCRHRVCRIGG